MGAASLMFRVAGAQLCLASATGDVFTSGQLQALASVMTRGGSEGVELAWMFQGAGSVLFFLLFLRSRYLPAALARLGIFSSALVIAMSLAMFVFPQYIGPLKLLGIPGFLAEITIACWLLAKGLPPETHSRCEASRDRPGGACIAGE